MWWLAAACTPNSGSADDSASSRPPIEPDQTTDPWGADVVIAAEDMEVFVTLETPLELSFLMLEDLDGDGIVDLLAVTLDRTNNQNINVQSVVLGPLDDVHLPDDAWVSLHEDAYSDWITPIELTGDAAIDVVVWGNLVSWFHPSPYDGSTAPGPGWVEIPPSVRDGWIFDVDRDGTVDRMDSLWSETAGESLEITWGPYDRFFGPPDVLVTDTCRGSDFADYPYAMSCLYAVGDLDGNGTPEITTTPWGEWKGNADCGRFTLSLPESGSIDPFDSPLSVDGLTATDLTRLGDWNGDGLPELWDASSLTLLVSPVTFTPDGVVGSDAITTDVILAMRPVPVDVDGDGRTEILATLSPSILALVPPDLDQLTDVQVETVWDVGLAWPWTYIDRGQVYLTVHDGTSLRRMALGPAVTP